MGHLINNIKWLFKDDGVLIMYGLMIEWRNLSQPTLSAHLGAFFMEKGKYNPDSIVNNNN